MRTRDLAALAALTAASSCLVAVATGSLSAGAVGAPAVTWTEAAGPTNHVVVADAAGAVVRTLPVDSTRVTLEGSQVLAGVVIGVGATTGKQPTGQVVQAYDAATGALSFEVPDAAYAFRGGAAGTVLFWPDTEGKRDPQVNSIWRRSSGGAVDKLVQFANGPGQPGIDTGLPGGGGLLATVADAAGKYVAVEEGIEGAEHDVWLVNAATKAAKRMTTGGASGEPSLSANGSSLAVTRTTGTCPKWTNLDLQVIPTFGAATPTTIFTGTCTHRVARPRWVSSHEIAVLDVTIASGKQKLRAAVIDVPTRKLRYLAGSPAVGLIANAGTGLVGVLTGADGGHLRLGPAAGGGVTLGPGFAWALAGARAVP